MDSPVTEIVIVGGGTAGWIAANRIAAAADGSGGPPLRVTLIESPDIPTVGVGEGTWPTMRRTLAEIGLDESDFLISCDASFKQGSRFDGWVDASSGDSYLHPFTPPPGGNARSNIAAWQSGESVPFARAVTPQHAVCNHDLAPRQRSMPPFSGALNYAYHLDAGKFARRLGEHATATLGVRHVRDRVTSIERDDKGFIRCVGTLKSGEVAGDLFLDCSGHSALLIEGEFAAPWVNRGDVLFNDRALVAQVPVEPGSAIASQTIATAHDAGWIWDIGLPGRRGVGCVYASQFIDDAEAERKLLRYLAAHPGTGPGETAIRKLRFESGHRRSIWSGNCLAIGLSAGFFEPLEASAIVMIELSVNTLLDNFPSHRSSIPRQASRFNELFAYHWDRVLDFLKLHYVLSRRDGAYWRAHRDPANIPDRLKDLLEVWREQPPSHFDLPRAEEIFPPASYQYVLYGMGYPPPERSPIRGESLEAARKRLADVRTKARSLVSALPANRTYLDALHAEAGADGANRRRAS